MKYLTKKMKSRFRSMKKRKKLLNQNQLFQRNDLQNVLQPRLIKLAVVLLRQVSNLTNLLLNFLLSPLESNQLSVQ